VAGYRRYCAYTRDPDSAGTWNGPDLARAQRLVAASGTRGTRITVWGWTDDATISPPVVRYVAGALRRLGYRTNVRLVPHSFFDHLSPAIFRSIQLIPYAWGDTSYGYFANWFACNAPQNHLSFCDRRIERTNTRARSLAGTDPRTAASLWTALDRKLVDRAVLVPMINEGGLWFVSARVRNYQSHPYWGLIADQLWVR
jgi:peptide/nickel transport system substrate-binding protein